MHSDSEAVKQRPMFGRAKAMSTGGLSDVQNARRRQALPATAREEQVRSPQINGQHGGSSAGTDAGISALAEKNARAHSSKSPD